jgi:hypothetical protein
MGTMGLSEFAVHNVLRTYSRQERLGGIRKAKHRTFGSADSVDQVELSRTGRKIWWVGSLAAELADRQYPDLAPEEKAAFVRETREGLLARHREEIARETVSPEAFETRLRSLYLI